MRGLVLGCYLFLCALLVRAEDMPGALKWIDGGFAPQGADFSVVFEFSDLKLNPGKAGPVAEWSGPKGVAAHLEMCSVKWPMGLSDGTLATVRLNVTNPTADVLHTTLSVRIAPERGIRALAFDRHSFLIGNHLILISDTPSRGAILADSSFAARPLTPQDQAHVESAKGECRGEMLFDLTLPPGQTQTLGFICPAQLPPGREPDLDFYRELSVDKLFTEAQKQREASDGKKP